jgi:hypothetical protein
MLKEVTVAVASSIAWPAPSIAGASRKLPALSRALIRDWTFLFQGMIARARLSQKRTAVFLRQIERCLQ